MIYHFRIRRGTYIYIYYIHVLQIFQGDILHYYIYTLGYIYYCICIILQYIIYMYIYYMFNL